MNARRIFSEGHLHWHVGRGVAEGSWGESLSKCLIKRSGQWGGGRFLVDYVTEFKKGIC